MSNPNNPYDLDISVIPLGVYCYQGLGITNVGGFPKRAKKVCPYWFIDPDRPRQENGFCAFLGIGDWEDKGASLLWDQVKDCGIHEEKPKKEIPKT